MHLLFQPRRSFSLKQYTKILGHLRKEILRLCGQLFFFHDNIFQPGVLTMVSWFLTASTMSNNELDIFDSVNSIIFFALKLTLRAF